MSEFNVQIKVEAGAAIPTIKEFGTALASTEIKATAMERAAVAIGRALSGLASNMKTDAMNAAGKAWGGIADQMKREADMLDRIKGPMREYTANQAALEMLFRRNMISAKEYTEQVAKLNAQFEKPKHEEHGPEGGGIGKAVAGRFGEVGSLASGAAGGVLEAGAVVAVAAEVGRLGDEYTALANKATVWATAGHNVNEILHDQLGLSRDIHGSLEQTTELYAAVRDGTDGMNLSYRNQIALTKSLAEEVQLSGKSLDQAGGLMSRLAFAFESGTLSGRELKGMLRDFPALGETLRETFGKTTAGLLTMANTGRLTPKMIMDALIEKAPEIEARFGKMVGTMGQTWQHLKDILSIEIGGSINLDALSLQVKEFRLGMTGLDEETLVATRNINALTEKLKQQTGDWYLFSLNIETAKRNVEAFHLMFAATNTELATNNTFTRALSGGIAEQHKLGDARQQLEALRLELKQGTIGWMDYRNQRDALETTLNGGKLPEEIKLLEAIKDPIADYSRSTEALNRLHKDNAISLAQYNEELERLIAAAPKAALGINTDNLTRRISHRQGYDPQLEVDTSTSTSFAESGFTEAERLDNDMRNKMVKDAEEAEKRKAEAENRIRTDKWKAELEGYKKHTAEIESAIKPIGDALMNVAKTGQFSWQSMFDALEAQALQFLESAAIKELAQLLGGLGGGDGGVMDYVTNGVHSGTPLFGGAHASGGSYTVPGSGGPDSQNVMFRLTPGEQVQFTPPGQQSAQAQQSAGPTVVQIHNHTDPNELLGIVDSPGGERLIMNIIRRNAAAIRSYTGGR